MWLLKDEVDESAGEVVQLDPALGDESGQLHVGRGEQPEVAGDLTSLDLVVDARHAGAVILIRLLAG